MKHLFRVSAVLLALVLATSPTADAQSVAGLSGWDLFLDPGHSRTENQGAFGYSEAAKNVEVALALKQLLVEHTDIDTVYLSRDNHEVEVSLSQRVDYANRVAADHFHSVHSNAASPGTNNALVLWPQYADGSEAVPRGGKRMAELMVDDLSNGMRIPSRGAIGECDFYVTPCSASSSGKGGSRNFVQKYTDMASELSEAGFHTNPTQNQRNMNADWKRLEAQAFFWSILAYHEVTAPPARIVTGIVRDVESGQPINGATVHVADTSYTTDTYESLFHRWSDDPDQLRNGFYYLDDLPDGTHEVVTEAEGYVTHQDEVMIDDGFFTFHDVALINDVSPTVASTTPAASDTSFRILDDIIIEFSRPMTPSTVEAAFEIEPATEGTFVWNAGDRRVRFVTDSLQALTEYTITIAGTAENPYGYTFDGDGDGTPGDAFTLSFRTGHPDAHAPVLVDGYPAPRELDVEQHPVISYAFDEEMDPATATPERLYLLHNEDETTVPGTLEHHVVNRRSVITFFPDEPLATNTFYRFHLGAGLEDVFGNATDEREVLFQTGEDAFTLRSIDDFDGNVGGTWWEPQQSGSTTGIVTDSTEMVQDTRRVNHLTSSGASLRVDYGWDEGADLHLIRVCSSDCDPNQQAAFDDGYALQVYVFGDGSGNQFRFAVDDTSSTEVSPWFTVDWIGWRLVSWDMDQDGTGAWIGDGQLDGSLGFDSIQLTYADGSPAFGRFYFDDLRLMEVDEGVATEPVDGTPDRFVLSPNYPNPFSTTTTLAFTLPDPADVKLAIYDALGRHVATLVDETTYTAGSHTLTWDAQDLPSGVYVARLQAEGRTQTVRMVLVR